MMRPLLRCRVGAGLLGLVLACGCRNSSTCCPMCDLGPPSAIGPAAPAAGGPAPVLHTVNKPATSYLPSAPSGAAAPGIVSVSQARTPAPIERPAGPRYAHDAGYHRLMGTLTYSRADGAWLLRYAPVQADDRYGGVVMLTDYGRTAGLKEGQAVQAEGGLIDPESRQLRPAFRVRALAPAGP